MQNHAYIDINTGKMTRMNEPRQDYKHVIVRLYKVCFTMTFLIFSYVTSTGQIDTTDKTTTSFGLELGGLIYSNNELGAFTGIHMSRSNSILSFVAAPLFITENDIIRLGGMFSVRSNVTPKGENYGVYTFTEFGVQYFEIRNTSGHYQKTILFITGLNLAMYYKSNQALYFHFGAGIDFGGPFVKYQPGFTGIVRTSFLISDIFKM